MKKILTLFVVAGFVACVAGVANANVNLLLNGDLDSPAPGATIDDWIKDESKTFSGPTSDLVTLEPWIEIAPITNGGGDNDLGAFVKAFQGNASTGDLATLHLYQDVAGVAGMKYILTGELGAGANYSGLIPGPTQTQLAIEFDDDNDRSNGWLLDAVTDVQAAGLAAGAFPDFGAQQFMAMGISPAGTTVVRARFSMIDGYGTQGGDQAMFIDDFNLCKVIPEPTSLALAGLGLLGLLGFRRRSR